MPSSLGSRIRSLFSSRDDASIELVMTANGLASLGTGAYVWWQHQTSLPITAALIAGVFLGLTACLLFRSTIWLAAILGSAALGACAGLLGAALGQQLHPAARWPGAVLAFLLVFALAASTYWRVMRIAQPSDR